jgi:hypothetical protein
MKIRPVGELVRAEKRTDLTKMTVAFRSFAEAPSNYSLLTVKPTKYLT